jgi:hypothetical protein
VWIHTCCILQSSLWPLHFTGLNFPWICFHCAAAACLLEGDACAVCDALALDCALGCAPFVGSPVQGRAAAGCSDKVLSCDGVADALCVPGMTLGWLAGASGTLARELL